MNHLTELQDLRASENCGIDQSGISKLSSLIKLDINKNNKITSVSHVAQLQVLHTNDIIDNLPQYRLYSIHDYYSF